MNINDISANDRLEIEYISDDPFKRNLKGIVLAVEKNSVIFITDTGECITLEKNNIISVKKNNFDKEVSESLTKCKNYYAEIYSLETKLKELKEKRLLYIQSMTDSKFLAKFNIEGAKNFLNNYFKDRKQFRLGDDVFEFNFEIDSDSDSDDELSIRIKAYKKFEFYNTENKHELDRALETYSPNKTKELLLYFPYIKDLFIEKRFLQRISDEIFTANAIYNGTISLTKENFIEVREKIENSLKQIKENEEKSLRR